MPRLLVGQCIGEGGAHRPVLGANQKIDVCDFVAVAYQRFADERTTLDLRALTVGQGYWVAIESFDENGVSALSAAVPIR